MLCRICQEILWEPREFGFGCYYPWYHSQSSFREAVTTGCHLCNLVFQHVLYQDPTVTYSRLFFDGHPNWSEIHSTYAFKALGREWARTGHGPKWLSPQVRTEDDYDEVARYNKALHQDPTILRIKSLLLAKSHFQTAGLDHPLVWHLYRPGPIIELPIEIAEPESAEDLAQTHLSMQRTTGSTENLALAKHWVNTCIDNHPQCRSVFQDSHWLPTRLIYVGSTDKPALRLIHSAKLEGTQRYATLSYCWGDIQDRVLTAHRLEEYEASISEHEIPRTVCDAIRITRGIGLDYLWVDRLCIIQGDDGDWFHESTTMSKVFGMSTCTIVAAHGKSGQDGCFVDRNQYRVRPCKIPNPFNHDSEISFLFRSQYLSGIYTREVKESPWYTRGWVFQERILSTRLLIFGQNQMIWACQKIQASEMWPCGKSSDDFIDKFESFEVEKRKFHSLCSSSRDVEPHNTLWWDFILEYTGCKTSRSSDRLIALQGIASRIEEMTGRVYVAGLWYDQTLLLSLLWRAASANLPKPPDQRAPSWSWGAIDGPIVVDLHPEPFTPMAEVLSKHVQNSQQEQQTNMSLVDLKISGGLVDAWLSNGSPVLSKSDPCEKTDEQLIEPVEQCHENEVPLLSKLKRCRGFLQEKWKSPKVGVIAEGLAIPFTLIFLIGFALWLLFDWAMCDCLGTYRWGCFKTSVQARFVRPTGPEDPGEAFETHSMRQARIGTKKDPSFDATVHLDHQVDLTKPLHLKLLPLLKFKYAGSVQGLILQTTEEIEPPRFERIGVFEIGRSRLPETIDVIVFFLS